MAESNLLGKIKGNTIDFRGLEQVVSRKDCEEFAATCGFEMMYYGYQLDPSDVDPSCKSENGKVHEVFWDSKEHELFRNTGHILKYPARQYCANCGKPMFVTKESQQECKGLNYGS